jgi:hypothetical protein
LRALLYGRNSIQIHGRLAHRKVPEEFPVAIPN